MGSKTRRQLSPLRIFAAPIFAQSSRSISFLTAAPRALTLAESSCQSSLCSSLLGAIPGALQGRALPFISACRLRGARCVCRAMQGRVARHGAAHPGAVHHGTAQLGSRGREKSSPRAWEEGGLLGDCREKVALPGGSVTGRGYARNRQGSAQPACWLPGVDGHGGSEGLTRLRV